MERLNRDDTRFSICFDCSRVYGAFLAVNAIPDAWLIVDSADCGTLRAELIQDNHDWNSTLISEDGRYRIANTGVSPDTIFSDRTQQLAALMRNIAVQEGSFLFVYPLPLTALLGIDYDGIAAGIDADLRMKVVTLRPVEALGNWLAGYSQVTETLAERIELPSIRPDPDTVALVGYFWDRNEADHQASVKELTRILSELNLSTSAVWLSGANAAGLAQVARAGTLLELPYAGATAKLLAARTGARVVPVDLPVGIEGTIRFVQQVAAATGREEPGRRLLEREAARCYRLLSKPVMRHFADGEFLVCTETHLAVAVARFLKELGARVRLLACSGARVEVPDGLADKVLVEVRLDLLGREMSSAVEQCVAYPALIGNQQAICACGATRVAFVPLGYRSGGIHFLHDAPIFGFAGALCLVDRIANAIALRLLTERDEVTRPSAGPSGSSPGA